MASLSEADFSCTMCTEIFTDPVILSCTHSFCKRCLQQFWRFTKAGMCPMCNKVSRSNPPLNRALKNLCELFVKERDEKRSSESEEICSLHSEKLKLFCLEDEQLVCLVCITSEKHVSHTVRPISEAVDLCKETLTTALHSMFRPEYHKIARDAADCLKYIEAQADHTERQIKQQFEKLHQFLRDEEEATITALREEEEQKKQMMKEKLEEMNKYISTRANTRDDVYEMLKDNDICFLKKFPGLMERVQISQPDPQTPSGALIHEPRYLGNLRFRVWKKMQDIVHYTPVILDPNTAHPHVSPSDDLTTVMAVGGTQADNLERFDKHVYILGSEGFTSGKHCWEVEIKQSLAWFIGVTTASSERKGWTSVNAGIWSLKYNSSDFSEDVLCTSPVAPNEFFVNRSLQRVRVDLDCDRGTVSFLDPITHTHIHTFTTTFTDAVFPFFYCSAFGNLRILPISSQQMLQHL